MTYLGQAIVNGRLGDLDNIFINCFCHFILCVKSILFGTTSYLESEIDLEQEGPLLLT